METTTNRRYNLRDRLGRFVRQVNHADMTVFINDDQGDTHSHTNCGNLKGRNWTVDGTQDGWLCGACIKVVVDMSWMQVPPSVGHHRCPCCGEVRHAKSFPTFWDGGVVFRNFGQCRKCRDADRAAAKAAAAAAQADQGQVAA